jgi:hypothetical protein
LMGIDAPSICGSLCPFTKNVWGCRKIVLLATER